MGACRTDTEYLAQAASTDPTYTWHDIYDTSQTESVQMPADSPVVPSGTDNHCVAIVEPDGTLYQSDNSTRPDNGDLYGALVGFPDFQTFGITTVTQDGTYGAHLGSGLSVLGGSIRAWEIQSGDEYVIQHAIKIELDQNLLWKNPGDATQSYIWPADRNRQQHGRIRRLSGTIPPSPKAACWRSGRTWTPESLGITTALGRKLFHAFQGLRCLRRGHVGHQLQVRRPRLHRQHLRGGGAEHRPPGLQRERRRRLLPRPERPSTPACTR